MTKVASSERRELAGRTIAGLRQSRAAHAFQSEADPSLRSILENAAANAATARSGRLDDELSARTTGHSRWPIAPGRTETATTTPNLMRQDLVRNVLASGVVFALALAAAANADLFDRPVTVFINRFAGRSDLFDRVASVVYWYPTFTGAALMALIWSCWFENEDSERRSRILSGTLAAVVAGMVSRFLQHALPTHPRPYYDAAIHFRMPLNQEPLLNTWHSFPSDHVTVFAGLVAVLFVARSRLAIPMLIYTAVMELARTYMGAHYPSDLIGGAALGFLCVWAMQVPLIVTGGVRIVAWERSCRPAFYAIAFFFSYQVAMLFTELRSAGSLLMHQMSQG
jgi:membrane-associated phospholipid phosphatase